MRTYGFVNRYDYFYVALPFEQTHRSSSVVHENRDGDLRMFGARDSFTSAEISCQMCVLSARTTRVSYRKYCSDGFEDD